MAGVMYRLDKRGHGEVARWGDDALSQAQAEQVFAAQVASGSRIADISDNHGKLLDKFDPTVAEMLVILPRVGG